ncbi:hypothetical protein [Haloglomus litoreum]|uniref:hypothetical protein n=1 Tax=Haloglomus litoreum TaxID=3034026 RepID=UPI0023E8A72A|nr:hypothetical protein [Haloglomus sp. DT116]
MAAACHETGLGLMGVGRRVARARARDGTLAVLALLGLVGILGSEAGRRLRDPVAALGGVGTALAVEWAFLRYPDRLLSLWERPLVNRGSAVALVAGAFAVRRYPRMLAAGIWGLATYLVLLARVVLRDGGDQSLPEGRDADR